MHLRKLRSPRFALLNAGYDFLNAATTVSIDRNSVRLAAGYSMNSAHFM